MNNAATIWLSIEKNVIKSVYNRRGINVSKDWNYSFLNRPCILSFTFFDAVLSILKMTRFNVSENVWHDIHAVSKHVREGD